MTDESRGPRRRRNVANRVNVARAVTGGSSGAASGEESHVVSSRQKVRIVQRDGRTEVSEEEKVEGEDEAR